MFLLKNEPFEAFATVPFAFTKHELDILVGLAKNDQTEGLIASNTEANKVFRDSKITWLNDSNPDYAWIFQRIGNVVREANQKAFGLDLRGFDAIQLTEYGAQYTGFYKAHTDNSYGMEATRYRKLSLVMQLSDPADYDGGDLKLYHSNLETPTIAAKERGMITLFRSHVLHEVTPVTRGTRYSLVTWIQGPLLK